jgi:hypothetical protein
MDVRSDFSSSSGEDEEFARDSVQESVSSISENQKRMLRFDFLQSLKFDDEKESLKFPQRHSNASDSNTSR